MHAKHIAFVRKVVSSLKEGWVRSFFILKDGDELSLQIASKKGALAAYKKLSGIQGLMRTNKWTVPSGGAKFGYGSVVLREDKLLFCIDGTKGANYSTIKSCLSQYKISLGITEFGLGSAVDLQAPSAVEDTGTVMASDEVEEEEVEEVESDEEVATDSEDLTELLETGEAVEARLDTATPDELAEARKALWDYKNQGGLQDIDDALSKIIDEQARRAVQESDLEKWQTRYQTIADEVGDLLDRFDPNKTVGTHENRAEAIETFRSYLADLQSLKNSLRPLI